MRNPLPYRQRGSADAELIIKGVMFLFACALVAAALIGLGVWSYNKAPEPSLTEKLAQESADTTRLQEQQLLLSQLPSDVRELRCTPSTSADMLQCRMVVDGILKLNIRRFDVSLVAGVPAIDLTFQAKGPGPARLTYGQPLSPALRDKLLRSIKPVAAPN